MAALEVEVRKTSDGGTVVALSGSIDERANLEESLGALEGDVTFDLRDVNRINSMGVHRWIPFVGRLARERRVSFQALSYPFVMQANCVMNLFGGAPVVSCLAPYYCNGCSASHMVLVGADEVSRSEAPPRRQCPDCEAEMEFDELENYFRFLRSTP